LRILWGEEHKAFCNQLRHGLLPRRKIETYINKENVNEAYLYNPRNCYQNYNVAVNLNDKVIHTYMGLLKPNMVMPTIAALGNFPRS